MKKTIKIIASFTLILLLTLALSLPSFATDYDFESATKDFVESKMNTRTLSVGDTHTPTASVWAEQNMAKCYSSNESVVTVSEKGVVTAVGEGSAYVVIDTGRSMREVYLYHVNPVTPPNTEGTITSSPSETPNTTTKKQLFQEYEDKKNEIQDIAKQNEEEAKKMATSGLKLVGLTQILGFVMMAVIGIPMLGLIIFMFASIIRLSSTSTKRKILPPLRETVNTIKSAPEGKGTFVVPMTKRMTAQKFETFVNNWLSENPYIADCKLKIKTYQSLFLPFVQHKFFVTNAVLEYTLSDVPQNHQFGFAFLYKFRPFGPFGYSEEKHVAEWHCNNTDCTVISSRGGRIQHFGQHGFYAQYYNYVFFRRNLK